MHACAAPIAGYPPPIVSGVTATRSRRTRTHGLPRIPGRLPAIRPGDPRAQRGARWNRADHARTPGGVSRHRSRAATRPFAAGPCPEPARRSLSLVSTLAVVGPRPLPDTARRNQARSPPRQALQSADIIVCACPAAVTGVRLHSAARRRRGSRRRLTRVRRTRTRRTAARSRHRDRGGRRHRPALSRTFCWIRRRHAARTTSGRSRRPAAPVALPAETDLLTPRLPDRLLSHHPPSTRPRLLPPPKSS